MVQYIHIHKMGKTKTKRTQLRRKTRKIKTKRGGFVSWFRRNKTPVANEQQKQKLTNNYSFENNPMHDRHDRKTVVTTHKPEDDDLDNYNMDNLVKRHEKMKKEGLV